MNHTKKSKVTTIAAATIVGLTLFVLAATNVSSNAGHYAFAQKKHVVITGNSVMTCRHSSDDKQEILLPPDDNGQTGNTATNNPSSTSSISCNSESRSAG
jgi:hypothetical protein